VQLVNSTVHNIAIPIQKDGNGIIMEYGERYWGIIVTINCVLINLLMSFRSVFKVNGNV